MITASIHPDATVGLISLGFLFVGAGTELARPRAEETHMRVINTAIIAVACFTVTGLAATLASAKTHHRRATMTSARMVHKRGPGNRGGPARWSYKRVIKNVKPGATLRIFLPRAPAGTYLAVRFGATTPGGRVYPRLRSKNVTRNGQKVRQVDVTVRDSYQLSRYRGRPFPLELADYRREGGASVVVGPVYHLSAQLEK
jgi:hypothetical protein